MLKNYNTVTIFTQTSKLHFQKNWNFIEYIKQNEKIAMENSSDKLCNTLKILLDLLGIDHK